MERRGLLLGALFLLFASAASSYTEPQRINFQGKLINPSTNNPETGSATLIFNLYNVATSGTSLWNETQTVTLTNGVFSVQLGSVAALSRDLFLNTSIYLGVTVQGDSEMLPRQNLIESAYAFSANQLSDTNEVRLIAGAVYSTFTSAGNLTVPGGVLGSSATFTNGLTASTGTFLGDAFSVGGSSFVVSGGSATVAYSLTAGSFVGPIGAGSINLSTVTAEFATKASSGTNDDIGVLGGAGAGLVIATATVHTGSMTVTGAGGLGVTYGVLAGSMTVSSTMTVLGNAFSVGGSSFVVSGGSATVAYSLTAGSFVGPIGAGSINLSTVTAEFATKASSGTNDDIGVLGGAGAGLVIATATVHTGSMTVTGAGGMGVTYGISAGSMTVTSTMSVQGSAFSVGGSSFSVTGGSATAAYSITAQSFIGDGTLLTNVVQSSGDVMTGALTMVNNSTITIQGNAFSVGGSSFSVAGGSATVGYSLTAGTFFGNGSKLMGIVSTSGAGDGVVFTTNVVVADSVTFQNNAFSVGGSSFSVAGGSATVGYSMTATTFIGDGTFLTNVVQSSGDVMTGPLTMINKSTITIQGNAFSVGGSSFTVSGGSATVAYGLTAAAFFGNGSVLTNVRPQVQLSSHTAPSTIAAATETEVSYATITFSASNMKALILGYVMQDGVTTSSATITLRSKALSAPPCNTASTELYSYTVPSSSGAISIPIMAMDTAPTILGTIYCLSINNTKATFIRARSLSVIEISGAGTSNSGTGISP